MPTNKNALLRYQILDRCFSNRHRKYTIEDLVDAVNEALYDMYGSEVSVRQIRDDIKYMRDRVSYDAPIEAIPFDGKRCYYRYTDPDFTIFNNELTVEEVTKLSSTINMLGRYRGGANRWLEEVISNLEFRFGIKTNREHIVSFEQNDQLRGLEFLSELIDSAINHQPLNLLYRTYNGKETTVVIHPYHVKQYNNRWFLFGLEQTPFGDRIANRPLDRIVKFSIANVPFIPNTYNFILKETCIYLYGVALFKSLGTNLFLHLCAMNCRPLSIDLDMGKTINGSRQLTYKCRESLVACLVALLATCRDT